MKRWRDIAGVILAYLLARQRQRLRTRVQIQRHQERRWRVMREWLADNSPFYEGCRDLPFEQWPVIDKRQWMQHFDRVNTAGITLQEAYAIAERAEHTRDFRPLIGDVSVGLSTGTSGARGVFLASSSERRQWAGSMLAKLLPDGVLANERVALLLRAGSNLYDTIEGVRLAFRFFDLMQPFDRVVSALDDYAPTILVGPAQALGLVARYREEGRVRLAPRRVISSAEVLDPLDQMRIERAWSIPVEQIYQATEGFLGHTCAHGVLHLNEDGLIVERAWIDRRQRRFVPIVTDLYRRTQPVVRYRLDDVLVERDTPCPCGSAHLALERIEGREDDIVWLQAPSGPVPLFADALTRTLLAADPLIQDYQVDQVASGTLHIAIVPPPDAPRRQVLLDALQCLCHAVAAGIPAVEFVGMQPQPLMGKRRRVRGMKHPQEPHHA